MQSAILALVTDPLNPDASKESPPTVHPQPITTTVLNTTAQAIDKDISHEQITQPGVMPDSPQPTKEEDSEQESTPELNSRNIDSLLTSDAIPDACNFVSLQRRLMQCEHELDNKRSSLSQLKHDHKIMKNHLSQKNEEINCLQTQNKFLQNELNKTKKTCSDFRNNAAISTIPPSTERNN